MGVAQLHVESNQFELPVVQASAGPRPPSAVYEPIREV